MTLEEFKQKYEKYSNLEREKENFSKGSEEETICKQMIADAGLLSDELEEETCYNMLLYNQIGTYGKDNNKPDGYTKCYKNFVMFAIYTACCQYLTTGHLEIGLDKLSIDLKRGKTLQYKWLDYKNDFQIKEVTRYRVEKGVTLFVTSYGKLVFDNKEKFYTYLSMFCETVKHYYRVRGKINCDDFEALHDGFCSLHLEQVINLI